MTNYDKIFGTGWAAMFKPFLKSKDYSDIVDILKPQGDNLIPKPSKIFQAFKKCPWEDVRVIMLGLNPEDESNQGLFLDSLYKVNKWAEQGVLMLSLNLTGSKKAIWFKFILYTIQMLNIQKGLIYVLVGHDGWDYYDFLDKERNDIYLVEHPMTAKKENRKWNVKEVMEQVSKASNFISDKPIVW